MLRERTGRTAEWLAGVLSLKPPPEAPAERSSRLGPVRQCQTVGRSCEFRSAQVTSPYWAKHMAVAEGEVDVLRPEPPLRRSQVSTGGSAPKRARVS